MSMKVAPWLPEVRGGGFSGALYGDADPSATDGYANHPPRMGFFTDTSVCIGCKACEVACKEWNDVPDDGLDLLGMSFDNTGMLGANSWRHVAFVEQPVPLGHPAGRALPELVQRPELDRVGGAGLGAGRLQAGAEPVVA